MKNNEPDGKLFIVLSIGFICLVLITMLISWETFFLAVIIMAIPIIFKTKVK